MKNLLPILRYELRTLLRQKSTWVFTAVLFAMGLLLMCAAAGVFPGAGVGSSRGKVSANAPLVIMSFSASLSSLAMLITAAVMGKAVQRDFEWGTASLFGTTPISRGAYLGGRFLGSLVVLSGLLASILLGMWVATLLPMAQADRLGPNLPAAYLWPLAMVILPNLFMTGAIFFSLGARLRRFGPVMTAAVLMLVGYLISQQLTRNLDHRMLAALIEPFGNEALNHLTRYWSIEETNTRLPTLSGVMLWNRLLWIGIGAVVAVVTLRGFRFGPLDAKPTPSRRAKKVPAAEAPRVEAGRAPVVPPLRWTPASSLRQLVPAVARQSFRSVVGTMGFRLTAMGGVLVLLAMAPNIGSMYGTETFPVTGLVIEQMGGLFSLFMLIIITVYAAELIWQERESGMGDVVDALPTPGWAVYLGKYLGLLAVVALLLGVLFVTGVLVQLGHGYTDLEPGLWLFHLSVVTLPDLALLCALAFVVHLVVHQKQLGHVVMVLFYAAGLFRSQLGLDHNLLLFGADPGLTYSDMNGYGHFLGPIAWFRAYWSGWALLMVIAAALLVVRGRETSWKSRLVTARTRFDGRMRSSMFAAGVLIVALGAWIFFNTNVLNTYRTRFQAEALQAGYEKTYKHLEAEPQPKVTASEVHLELYPERREATFQGTLSFLNRSDAPISTLYVNVPPASEPAEVRTLSFDVPHRVTHRDPVYGLWTVTLDAPLAPGDTTDLTYEVHYAPRGIENTTGWTRLAENGTFLDSDLLPSLGYRKHLELRSDRVRKEHGLEAHPGMRAPDAPGARDTHYVRQHSDWISFKATIGTSPDQIALAPGYLQGEWEANGRRYFEYAMDAPILDFYSFLSARWEVRRDRWNDVAIEVYHHPPHAENVERMIAATKRSLDYFSRNFGPYQHRQFRILEFPRYMTFAQAFPNTIPYSEALGFIAKVDPDDPEDVDYPTYITAHEAAHQWWAHQVIGADAQGATMLSETLAQYSALMVMKEQYGDHRMRKFLEYELDRYLRGRSQEMREERPIARVENQGYIHYQKGGLAMYALQDYVGEEAVNSALRRFRDTWAFKGPPYPTSDDLLKELYAVTPEALHDLVHDLFEDIVLYDNRALSANAKALDDGRYEVTLDLRVTKTRADGQGKETPVELNDLLEVGVLDAEGTPLYLEKHRLTQSASQLTLTVKGKPAKAGVDPFIKLIDLDPDDNTVAVEL
ncbi:MAG TPA: ABC transporter permease subunit [Myxococcaceae bacterium]|nr:ABC transporter permease subunit [Myxococcaceae bacterium]